MAKALVDRLARTPRPAGSAAEAEARALCAAELGRHGFAVVEEPFTYSALCGRYATPLGGVASGVALVVAGYLGARGQPGQALLLLAGALCLLGAGGWWLARHGVLDAPVLRRSGVNLVARRGAPRIWLVAHVDSKSQPVPIAARALGIVASALCWLAAFAVAAGQLLLGDGAAAWPWVSGAGVLAAAPVIASVVGGRSPGALDNASGVAAVLLAAAALPAGTALGVLVPSAEELGLAGARAWAREGGVAPGVAINCDGVDDSGMLTLMHSGRRPGRLIDAAERAGRIVGEPVRAMRLLPGILTDGVALADAGWECVTVSRGTLGTLARIHTPADGADRLTGEGVTVAAALIAAMVGELDRASEG